MMIRVFMDLCSPELAYAATQVADVAVRHPYIEDESEHQINDIAFDTIRCSTPARGLGIKTVEQLFASSEKQIMDLRALYAMSCCDFVLTDLPGSLELVNALTWANVFGIRVVSTGKGYVGPGIDAYFASVPDALDYLASKGDQK